MPRNNSLSQRTKRRETALARAALREQALAELRSAKEQAGTAVLQDTADIIENAAIVHSRNAAEVMHQRDHFCGNPGNCTLHPKVCSALNQNQPPRLIVGQIPATD